MGDRTAVWIEWTNLSVPLEWSKISIATSTALKVHRDATGRVVQTCPMTTLLHLPILCYDAERHQFIELLTQTNVGSYFSRAVARVFDVGFRVQHLRLSSSALV